MSKSANPIALSTDYLKWVSNRAGFLLFFLYNSPWELGSFLTHSAFFLGMTYKRYFCDSTLHRALPHQESLAIVFSLPYIQHEYRHPNLIFWKWHSNPGENSHLYAAVASHGVIAGRDVPLCFSLSSSVFVHLPSPTHCWYIALSV